jgi:type VI secretion system protein ImpE
VQTDLIKGSFKDRHQSALSNFYWGSNMLAEQTLRDGNLDEALAQLQDQVRKDPSNAKYRTFLFQLLSVMGNWDRAINQLKVAGELDPGTLAMVQTYREAIRCEVLRADIFAGKHTPLFFGEPEAWMALMVEALNLTAQGKYPQSQEVRARAFETAPTTSGQIDGQPFEWIADADPRLGPILEVIINGQYYWVPIHQIQRILIDEPTDLRDAVWMPASFTWVNGGETVGLIPTRYPGSESTADAAIRLARKTEWAAYDAELYLGLGQRLLSTDNGDFPLMDIREITLNSATQQSTEQEP